MNAQDLVFQVETHGQSEAEVIIMIDGTEHRLTGTVVGDSEEGDSGELYIYAE